MLLLFMFPCLVTGMVYLFCLALAWLGLMDGTMAEEAAAEGSLWYHANSAFLQSVPYAFGGVLIWFVMAYFFNTLIIKASTGAKSLERKDGKRVYNLVENLCMSQGMKMPKICARTVTHTQPRCQAAYSFHRVCRGVLDGCPDSIQICAFIRLQLQKKRKQRRDDNRVAAVGCSGCHRLSAGNTDEIRHFAQKGISGRCRICRDDKESAGARLGPAQDFRRP